MYSEDRVVLCGRTDMTKLIVAFLNFKNAPKNHTCGFHTPTPCKIKGLKQMNAWRNDVLSFPCIYRQDTGNYFFPVRYIFAPHFKQNNDFCTNIRYFYRSMSTSRFGNFVLEVCSTLQYIRFAHYTARHSSQVDFSSTPPQPLPHPPNKYSWHVLQSVYVHRVRWRIHLSRWSRNPLSGNQSVPQQ